MMARRLQGCRFMGLLLVGLMVSSPVKAETPGPPMVPFQLSGAPIPEGPLGEAIRYGQELVMNTTMRVPEYVGNGLKCRNCHLGGGTTPNAMPYVGLPGLFPAFRPRSGKVITLQERINGCFQRSLNGKPLPFESREMTALIAYMTWLSQGIPMGTSVEGRGTRRLPPSARKPDRKRGLTLFLEKCAHCHGAEGQGTPGENGQFLFPPLWGDQSFNIAAGMARLNTAAAFVKHNMPFQQGETLSDQDAYDLASFFTAQPRPDFARKGFDWPNGGKPTDARY